MKTDGKKFVAAGTDGASADARKTRLKVYSENPGRHRRCVHTLHGA